MGYRPPPGLVYAIARPLTRSLRVHSFGLDHLRTAARMSPTGTTVICLWHQNLLLALAPASLGLRLAALASLSGDGAIIADYLERIGVHPVRGSSARGGARAAKELTQALGDGYHLVIAIDGPRGPYKQVKTGTLEFARRQGVPLVPLGVRATGEWRMHSWDRFRVPLPRAHVAMVFGAPVTYPPGEPDADTLAARCREFSLAINQCEARAADHVGRADRWPVARHLAWLRRGARTEP
jgi:lysophospholipid acyltransferase (LPLAT)-like uncharacterized protein